MKLLFLVCALLITISISPINSIKSKTELKSQTNLKSGRGESMYEYLAQLDKNTTAVVDKMGEAAKEAKKLQAKMIEELKEKEEKKIVLIVIK